MMFSYFRVISLYKEILALIKAILIKDKGRTGTNYGQNSNQLKTDSHSLISIMLVHSYLLFLHHGIVLASNKSIYRFWKPFDRLIKE